MQKIFLIGAGRLGGSLSKCLTKAGFEVAVSSRRKNSSCPAFPVHEAEVVFICVPDDAIESIAEANAPYFTKSQVVAHCSGAHDLQVLSTAAQKGAHLGSLHPLRAIPSSRTKLAGSFAAIEGDLLATNKLTSIAHAIGLTPFVPPSSSRSLYHCAACLASNGLVALAEQSVELLSQCALSPDQALDALLPLMQSAIDGLKRYRLPKALTGPIVRGDISTVSRHMEALSQYASPSAMTLYGTLATIILKIAAPGLSASSLQLLQEQISNSTGVVIETEQ